MTNDFMVASAEILDIFQYIPIDLKNKIPKNLIELFEKSAIKDYSSVIDPDRSITEQKISENTKTILSILYLKYWANEEEKEKTYKVIHQNEIEYQEKLRKKYNPDNIFKKDNITVVERQETALAEVKKKTFIQRIINKIRSIFKRK